MLPRIFKTRNKPGKVSNTRFVGVQFPYDLFSYIALHSAATGTTKSHFICECIEGKIKKDAPDISNLIKAVEERFLKCWKITSNSDPSLSYETFMETMKTELQKKGVSKMHLDIILTDLKEKYGTNK